MQNMKPQTIREDTPQAERSELRFAFGKNWASYIDQNFSEERIAISLQYMLDFLKLPDMSGQTFLDIGCGSGLHSLAALRANARSIVSFDYDPQSVATTRKLHAYCGSPSNWQVLQGSILDEHFVETLPKSDIVYSWGVLHHTGNMWQALRNTAGRLNADGVLYVALYSSDMHLSPTPEYWIDLKRKYNRSWGGKKLWMEVDYAWNSTLKHVIRKGQSPLEYIRNYKKERGMSFWHDVRDWLGGYPMEFAGNRETRDYCREQLGLELIHAKAGAPNTEYLFRRAGASTYWDRSVADERHLLPGPFVHADGLAWAARLPRTVGNPKRLMLYENDIPLGWPQATLKYIVGWGQGRYRVENDSLIFSSTDNTDPNTEMKRYSFRPDFL